MRVSGSGGIGCNKYYLRKASDILKKNVNLLEFFLRLLQVVLTIRLWRAGPTDKELEKEVVSYLIKTESARDRHQREKENMETRRLHARVLGEDPDVLHNAVATGVQGLPKPARPKVALGLAACCETCNINAAPVSCLRREPHTWCC